MPRSPSSSSTSHWAPTAGAPRSWSAPGSTFPHCLQSEIANLSGSLTGTGAIQLGATVDGPSDPANFDGLGSVDGMRACSAGSYAPFNTSAAAYEDNVVSWPSVEPSDDYTAASLLAFALAAR